MNGQHIYAHLITKQMRVACVLCRMEHRFYREFAQIQFDPASVKVDGISMKMFSDIHDKFCLQLIYLFFFLNDTIHLCLTFLCPEWFCWVLCGTAMNFNDLYQQIKSKHSYMVLQYTPHEMTNT